MVALALLLHGLVVALTWRTVAAGELPDTDDYTRLLRVRELASGGGWYDTVLARGNAPFGESLHWTRLHDLLILALAAPLRLVLPLADAVHGAGLVVSPLLYLLAVAAAGWAARPLASAALGALPGLALIAQPIVLSFAVVGRADHHMLQLLLFLLGTGWLLRLCVDPDDRRAALGCGLCCALGVWVSVELLLLPLFALAALAVLWIARGGREDRAATRLAWDWTAATAVALVVERPPSEWLVVETDRLAGVHVLVAAIAAVGWLAVRAVPRRLASSARGRALAGAVLAAAGLGVLRLSVPVLFAGPMAATDDIVWTRWLDWIAEYRPLLVPRDVAGLGRFLMCLGPALIVAPFVVRRLRAGRGRLEWGPWVALAIGLPAFVALGLYMVRFSGYAEVLLALALGCVVQAAAERLGRLEPRALRLVLRPLALAALILGCLLAGAALLVSRSALELGRPDEAGTASLAPLLPLLTDPQGLGDRPRTIAAFAQSGPELLYRTPHRTLASPYHRNAAGLRDVHALFTARDDEQALDVVRRRGVDLLLLCPAGPERIVHDLHAGDGSLHDRLCRGERPAWLAPVPLPPGAEGWLLFEVRDAPVR